MPNPFERRRSLRGGLRHTHFLGLALPALAACSTTAPPDTTPPPDSGVALDAGPFPVDRATKRDLTDLTLQERKALCDWTANVGGGYGHTTSCGGGLSVANADNQAACLASYPGDCYTVLVSEWEACRRKELSDPCALLLFSAPECRRLRICMERTDGGPARSAGSGG